MTFVKRLFITFGLQNLMKLPKMEPEMVLHFCPAIRPKRLDSRPLSHAPNLVTPSPFESSLSLFEYAQNLSSQPLS